MKIIDRITCPPNYSCEECIKYNSVLNICLVLNKIMVIKLNSKYKDENRFRKNFGYAAQLTDDKHPLNDFIYCSEYKKIDESN